MNADQWIDKLNWRYATKSFDSEKIIGEDDINTLLEAFNLTATSYGLQPIKLIVIKDKALQEQLVPLSFNQKQVMEASHLFVFCIDIEHAEGMRSALVNENGDLFSENNKYYLMLVEHDLSIYDAETNATLNHIPIPNIAEVILQKDGNFCMYGSGGEFLWCAFTQPNGYEFLISNDGNLIITNKLGEVIWSTREN